MLKDRLIGLFSVGTLESGSEIQTPAGFPIQQYGDILLTA